MAVLGVVPREERSAEAMAWSMPGKRPGETGMVLQGLELRLGERIVIAHLRAAQ